MPVIKRNQNRSDRQGLGLGPCGAGQARGRASMGYGMDSRRGLGRGMGRGMGQGAGRGMGRGNGMCRYAEMSPMTDERYEMSLEARIIELEEENRKLRQEASR